MMARACGMENLQFFLTRVDNHVTNLSSGASNFLLAIDIAVCTCLPSIHFCGMFGIKHNAIPIQITEITEIIYLQTYHNYL